MAKNSPFGDGHRHGAVKDRSQTFNPTTEQWVKREPTLVGLWMSSKMGHHLKALRKKNNVEGSKVLCEQAIVVCYTKR